MLKTPTLNTTKNLTPKECRGIISEIPNNVELASFISRMKTPKKFDIYDCQKFFETMYILALRVGEICGCKTNKDINKPTGNTLRAEKAIYQPDPTVQEELNNLAHLTYTHRLLEGNDTTPTLKEILSIQEPAGFFYVQTEKRKDNYLRKTAIPLMDPMAKDTLEYLIERQTEPPIFPINRQQALRLANIIFQGYTYRIKAYWRDLGGEKILVPTNYKKVGAHAMRHMRLEEVKKLGVRGPQLKAFVGWTLSHADQMEDTYIEEELYRCYIPYLLMQKHN